MNGKTHMVGGVALALTVSIISGYCCPDNLDTSLISTGVFLSSAGAGALIPDIDKKNSSISQRYKVISFLSRLFFTHRGFTHSILCMGLLGAVLLTIKGIMPMGDIIFVGLMIGYASHLVLDSLNPMGIPLFYPNKTRFSLAGIKTGGFMEIFVFIGLLLIVLVEGYLITKLIIL